MAINRDITLQKAEKLLRQGRLEASIAEYAKLVDDQPRDWATANLLGDLCVRAGQVERAVALYARAADQLAHEGFLSKATALFKKISRINPADDTALLRAAELASRQGLGADARSHLQALFHQRLSRSDRPGAIEAAVRLAEIDPSDAVGRLEAATLLAGMGEPVAAGEQWRAAGQAHYDAGKVEEGVRAWREALRLNDDDEVARGLVVRALLERGELDAARDVARKAADLQAVAGGLTRAGRAEEALQLLEQALAAAPDNVGVRLLIAQAAMKDRAHRRAMDLLAPIAGDPSPDVQVALAELELRLGCLDHGTAAIERCLASGSNLEGRLAQLACDLATDGVPDAGYAIVSALLQRAEAAGDVDRAIAVMERFVLAAPTHVAALEQLVRLSADGFYEDRRYRAQVKLADAYLAHERWHDARVLAEALRLLRPDDAAHLARLTRALVGLGVPDAAAVARGQSGGAGGDEITQPAAERAARPSPADQPHDRTGMPGPETADSVPFDRRVMETSADFTDPEEMDSAFDLELLTPIPGHPRAMDGGARAFDQKPEVYDIDLGTDVDGLIVQAAAPLSRPSSTPDAAPDVDASLDLDGYFDQLRETSGRGDEEARAARAYDRASESYNQGDIESAIDHLRTAVRDVTFRFRAGSMLARIARERGQVAESVEWLERAADAPAPTPAAAHALLYELADTLEAAGEPARALAVCLELQAASPGYRDVAGRIARLSDAQDGGADKGRGPA